MKLDFYGIKSNQILYINHRRVIIVTLYGVRSYHTFIVCVTMYQIKLRLNLNILYIYNRNYIQISYLQNFRSYQITYLDYFFINILKTIPK